MSAGFWITLIWLVSLLLWLELGPRTKRRELWRSIMAGMVGLSVRFGRKDGRR